MANEALNALAMEAHRLKISYGELMAITTQADRERIVEKYMEWKKKANKGK